MKTVLLHLYCKCEISFYLAAYAAKLCEAFFDKLYRPVGTHRAVVFWLPFQRSLFGKTIYFSASTGISPTPFRIMVGW